MAYRLMIVLLFVFALTAQAQDVPPPVTTPEVSVDPLPDDGVFRLLTVQEHLAARPDLSIAAQIWSTLPAQQRPVTLFVPNDVAWNTYFALLGVRAEDWLADPAAVSPLLNYHRAEDALTPALLTTGLPDARLSVLQTPDDRLVVNGAALVLEAILTEDGLLYIIDAVLVPPQESLVVPAPQTTEEAFLPESTVPPPVPTAEVNFDDDDDDDSGQGRGRGRGRGGDDDDDDESDDD